MQWLFEGPISWNIRVERAVDYAIAITIIVSETYKKKKKPLFPYRHQTFPISETGEEIGSEMYLYVHYGGLSASLLMQKENK